jgi:hypothetical protein
MGCNSSKGSSKTSSAVLNPLTQAGAPALQAALVAACRGGDLAAMATLLAAGADADARGGSRPSGSTRR